MTSDKQQRPLPDTIPRPAELVLRLTPGREELRRLYLDGTIEGVALVNADANACGTCKALGDRAYLPWELPDIPVAGCTSPSGCRCRAEPEFVVVE